MRYLLLLLLFMPSAFGATITGTVYDFDLTEVTTAVVTIDTQPEQRIVAKDGTYSFTVTEGTYDILATANIDGDVWLVEEKITVSEDGVYTYDLLLSPSFTEIDEFTFDVEDLSLLDSPEQESSLVPIYLFFVGMALIACIWIFYSKLMKRYPKKLDVHAEDDEFRAAVLGALHNAGGRMTQRELRKEVPFSEAKVSLVISELESEGKVEKIKKGRGNILKLSR